MHQHIEESQQIKVVDHFRYLGVYLADNLEDTKKNYIKQNIRENQDQKQPTKTKETQPNQSRR